jgi:DNA-binding Lrp family transcriptional regulator
MSIEMWNLVLNARFGNPAKKAIMLGLANHAGPDGKRAFPSVKRLSIYSELSESTVRSKLAELRDEGVIRITKKSYRYRPTEYELNVSMLKEMRDSDLHLLEVSHDTPISGDTQTSEKTRSDLQETDIRPPGDGGKPYLTIINPSEKEKRNKLKQEAKKHYSKGPTRDKSLDEYYDLALRAVRDNLELPSRSS